MPSDDVVWAPKVLQGWEERSRGSGFYLVLGRLAPEVSFDTAVAELEVIAGQLESEHPTT